MKTGERWAPAVIPPLMLSSFVPAQPRLPDSSTQEGAPEWHFMHSLALLSCCSWPVGCVHMVNQKIVISQLSLIFQKQAREAIKSCWLIQTTSVL